MPGDNKPICEAAQTAFSLLSELARSELAYRQPRIAAMSEAATTHVTDKINDKPRAYQ